MPQAEQRVVIVTGGTGALGRSVVEAFLAAGDRVTVPWIVEAEAKAMVSHEWLTLLEADVSEAAGAEATVQRAGEVDVLVNGVGGFAGGTPVHATDLEVWDRLYRMNVRTAVSMSRAVLPGLLARQSGAVVNIASKAAEECPGGISAYSATKAALVALTRTLDSELRGSGVRANAVVPTTIDTPANRLGMPDADFSTWTPTAEIARVILWLASDAAKTVSGGLIPV
ncbi:MAG: SDR family NAD(P)-dependent oxidoreductase [Planctomycetota bacterium]